MSRNLQAWNVKSKILAIHLNVLSVESALPAILSTFSGNRKEEKDKEVEAEPVLRKQNSSETPVDIYISLAGGVSVAM